MSALDHAQHGRKLKTSPVFRKKTTAWSATESLHLVQANGYIPFCSLRLDASLSEFRGMVCLKGTWQLSWHEIACIHEMEIERKTTRMFSSLTQTYVLCCWIFCANWKQYLWVENLQISQGNSSHGTQTVGFTPSHFWMCVICYQRVF